MSPPVLSRYSLALAAASTSRPGENGTMLYSAKSAAGDVSAERQVETTPQDAAAHIMASTLWIRMCILYQNHGRTQAAAGKNSGVNFRPLHPAEAEGEG